MSGTKKWDRTEEFFDQARRMMPLSKMNEDIKITPDNVYQEAFKPNREMLFQIMKLGHLPGSTILGADNIKKLHTFASEGKSCLVLSEHLSNMDVPSLFTRFYDHGDEELKNIFEKFVFIAGAKLNQTPLVKLFTEMFTRVVIYAVRILMKLDFNEENKQEIELAKKINMRSTRKILELRNKGHIFVLYPTGTRYREWDPSSGQGMKETMTYLNSFDYLCCCSINGNNMPPREHEDMTKETFTQDIVTFNFGEVFKTEDFVKTIQAQHAGVSDKDAIRQFQVDAIMEKIKTLHKDAETYRQPLLEEIGYFS